jgi:hypothetical protein
MEFKLVRGLFCQVLHTDPISVEIKQHRGKSHAGDMALEKPVGKP